MVDHLFLFGILFFGEIFILEITLTKTEYNDFF